MKNIITTIIGGVIVIYMSTIGVYSYKFYYEDAKESSITEWYFLGEYKALFKGLIWPYYVFFNENEKLNPKTEESLEHFYKSILYIQEAYSIENTFNEENELFFTIDKKNIKFKNALSYRKQALNEAKKVDLISLNKLDDNLKQHYNNEFILGLEYYIDGTENENIASINKGRILLNKFGDFYDKSFQHK